MGKVPGLLGHSERSVVECTLAAKTNSIFSHTGGVSLVMATLAVCWPVHQFKSRLK